MRLLFLSIANLIHQNVDLVLLTLFTDAKVISVYTVYYLVVGKIKQLMQIVTTGMVASLMIRLWELISLAGAVICLSSGMSIRLLLLLLVIIR